MHFIKRAIDLAICMGMLFITVLTFTRVGLRYFGNAGLPGGNELILLGAMWVYFLGMARGTLSNAHIKGGIEELFENTRVRASFVIITHISFFAFSIFAFWFSLRLFMSSIEHGYATVYYGMPVAASVAALVVGFALNVLIAAIRFMHSMKVLVSES